MSAMSELDMTHGQTLRRLISLKVTLATADTLADAIREKALRDYTSDEPYATATSLSAKVSSALAMVEIMLEDLH